MKIDHEEDWYDEAESVDVSDKSIQKYADLAEREGSHSLKSEKVAKDSDEDEEIRVIAKQLRRERFKNTKFSPIRLILMLAVFVFVPWQIWGDRDDVAYYFESNTPQDLGSGMDYRRPGLNESFEAKPQDFADNSFVKMQGFPVRMMGIETNEGLFKRHQRNVLFQVNGSGVFVQEALEGSQFVHFFSQTGAAFNSDNIIDYIEVQGRLRSFEADKHKIYQTLREHLSKRYNMHFCTDLSQTQRLRAQSLLGKGGLVLNITDGENALPAISNTQEALLKTQAVSPNHIYALGRNNTLISSTDAGNSWESEKLPNLGEFLTFAWSNSAKWGLFAGAKGLLASATTSIEKLEQSQNLSAQDILDLAIIDENRAALVGRESLVMFTEDGGKVWNNAKIRKSAAYNAVSIDRGANTILVAGSDAQLMSGDLGTDLLNAPEWLKEVSPLETDYLSLTLQKEPGGQTLGAVATGTKHAVVYRSTASKTWTSVSIDTCPGIDLDDAINDSSFDRFGKSWVGVGEDGTIVRTAQFNEEIIEAIAGKNRSYTLAQDLTMGKSLPLALSRVYNNHTDRELNAVSWHGGNFYAVGARGLVMKSADLGQNWTKEQLQWRTNNLHDIAFYNDEVAYIAGAEGLLLKSTDGAKTWKKVEVNTKRNIYKLYVHPEISDGIVFAGSQGLWGYCYVQNNECYVRTKSQDFTYYDLALAAPFSSMNKLQLIATGSRGVLQSISDRPGASDESTQELLAEREESVHAMGAATEYLPFLPSYPRGMLALAVGSRGAVWRSLDGGFNFKLEPSGTLSDLHHLAMLQNGERAAIASKEAVFVDNSARGQWRQVPFSRTPTTQAEIIGVTFNDQKQLFVLSTACVFSQNPESQMLEPLFCSDVPLVAFAFVQNKLFVANTAQQISECDPQSDVAGNAEGSVRCEQGEPIVALGPVAQLLGCGDALFALSQNSAFVLKERALEALGFCENEGRTLLCHKGSAFCVKKNAVVSMGQGENVQGLPLNFPSHVEAFAAGNEKAFWAAGEGIYKNTDATHWSLRRSESLDMRALTFSDDGQWGIAVGDRGAVLLSRDGGKTWEEQENSERQTLRAVCVSPDATSAMAVGDGGAILKTQRLTGRWSKLGVDLNIDLNACAFTHIDGQERAVIAGKGGALYISDDDKMSRFRLISSPSFEDIRSLTAVGEHIVAVGGQKQDAAQICEDAFILIANQKPSDMRWWVILYAVLALFWLYTVKNLITMLRQRVQSKASEDTSEQL